MNENDNNRSQLPKPPEPVIIRDSFESLEIGALPILIIIILFTCLLK